MGFYINDDAVNDIKQMYLNISIPRDRFFPNDEVTEFRSLTETYDVKPTSILPLRSIIQLLKKWVINIRWLLMPSLTVRLYFYFTES